MLATLHAPTPWLPPSPQTFDHVADWLELLPRMFPAGCLPYTALVAAKGDLGPCSRQVQAQQHNALLAQHQGVYRWEGPGCGSGACLMGGCGFIRGCGCRIVQAGVVAGRRELQQGHKGRCLVSIKACHEYVCK